MNKAIAKHETIKLPGLSAGHANLRVAIVHDWLVVYGGAERVLEHILDCYPQADLYSLIDFVPASQRHFLRDKTPKTSFLQRIPRVDRHYRKLLPIMPLAIEQFDLSEYDLVISSSYCVAKGVMTGPNQVHVSYCHSPMRYAWDHYHEYLRELGLTRGLKSWFARWQLHNIRTWDVRSSNTVDHFVANSKFVQARISKYYGRDSNLVYPPVDTSTFRLETRKEDFYVAAGRFVPFKRLDLVVDAFASMPDKKLVVIGDGPEMERLKSNAAKNIDFLGFQPPEVMRDYLSRCKAFLFPSEEDFGILPVEAQACGTPVIAFGSGGALETVLPVAPERTPGRATGIWFAHQTPESVIDAVLRFEAVADRFDPQFISKHAASFNPERFKAELVAEIDEALGNRFYVPKRCPDPTPAASPLTGHSPTPQPPAPAPQTVFRFGVPITIGGRQITMALLDKAFANEQTAHPLVVTSASWQDLELASRDRNYQFALNDADLVLPQDAPALDNLCRDLREATDWVHMGTAADDFLKQCAVRQLRAYLVTADKADAGGEAERLAARAPGLALLGASVLPADSDSRDSLLEVLKDHQPDVLLMIGTGRLGDEWIARHRRGITARLVLSLPPDAAAGRPTPRQRPSAPLIRLPRLRRTEQRALPAASVWWRRLAAQARLKRTLDVGCALLGLLLLSPVLLVTAAAIRLESDGPILFRQLRVGLRGRPFTMYKFRSMYIDAEAQLTRLLDRNDSPGETLFKMKHDPRITRVGRIIRRFSIDELPQLVNVLRGDMAVVGPRPALPSEVAGYDQQARKRLQVKPGLTCLWQIGGRSELGFDDQLKLDLTYLGDQRVTRDVGIVLQTIPAVLSGKGAY